jgi:phage tail-like protein
VRTLTSPAALEERRVADLPEDRWSSPLEIGPQDWPEVLIQSAPGQYLWLDVELNGDGASTPLVRAITLYAPRRSSLQYLPPVFHDDAVSAHFLDRFLSYFDTIFDEILTQIERFTAYLDPDGVPSGAFLNWLGSWLDVVYLSEWDEQTRREFVRRAIALYKQRGTVGGLQEVLRLHAGLSAPMPAVIEHYRLRNYAARHEGGGLVDGQLYLGGSALTPEAAEVAHHFTVLLPERAVPSEDAYATVRHVIDGQKPAHTHYELRVFKAGLRVGCQSTVGVDALIGPYPTAPLDELKLGQSSQLTPERPRLGSAALARSE